MNWSSGRAGGDEHGDGAGGRGGPARPSLLATWTAIGCPGRPTRTEPPGGVPMSMAQLQARSCLTTPCTSPRAQAPGLDLPAGLQRQVPGAVAGRTPPPRRPAAGQQRLAQVAEHHPRPGGASGRTRSSGDAVRGPRGRRSRLPSRSELRRIAEARGRGAAGCRRDQAPLARRGRRCGPPAATLSPPRSRAPRRARARVWPIVADAQTKPGAGAVELADPAQPGGITLATWLPTDTPR